MEGSFSRSAGVAGSLARVLPWKFLIVGAAAILLVTLAIPTSITYISPGHIGIVIHRAGGGVDSVPLGPGFHTRNPLFTGWGDGGRSRAEAERPGAGWRARPAPAGRPP